MLDHLAAHLHCHTGTTTALLHTEASKAGGAAVGVDVSASIVSRAKALHPEPRFDVCDAWDVRGLLAVAAGRPIDLICVDVGGLSSAHGLLDTLALLRQLEATFGVSPGSPQAQAAADDLPPLSIVMKSHCLRSLAMQMRSAHTVGPAA